MNKRIILLVILVLSLTMIFAGCSSQDASIGNGDFSSFDKNFSDWQISYDKESAANVRPHLAPTDGTAESDQDKGHGNYIEISASKEGVNYIYQSVSLKKGMKYRLAVDYKASSSSSGDRAAYAGFIEDAKFFIDMKNATQSVWNTNEAYFTPATSGTYTLAVGIGHPSAKTVGDKTEAAGGKGTVFFDNVVLEAVDEVPPTVTNIATIKNGGSRYTLADGSSTAFVVVGAILTAVIIALFMYVYRKTMSREMLSAKKLLSPIALFIYMMLIAFVIRFLLAFFTGGMASEINSLTQIALKFNGTKISEIMFAANTMLPAGMLYLLGLVNGLAGLFHIGGDGFALLIRLPFILADLVAIYMIYSILSSRTKEHTAIIVAGLYAVLPSIIMASTGWGMVISLVGCLLIGMYYAMLRKNYIGVSVLYMFSLLFSNYVVLLLPLVLAFSINAFVKYSDARLKIGLSALASLIVFYGVTVPFVVTKLGAGQPFYYFSAMFNDLVAYNVLSADAFNLYAIFGLNMVKIPVAINVLNYIFVILLMVSTVLLYMKNRDRLNVILMSAFTLIAISTLCARGDIKIMVLGIILLFLYAAVSSSRRAYALVGGFSTLSFINMSLVMSNSGFISNQLNANNIVHFFATDPALIVLSIIAVAMTIYMGYVVFDVCFRERSVEIAPLDGKLKDDIKTRYMLFKERKAHKTHVQVEADED